MFLFSLQGESIKALRSDEKSASFSEPLRIFTSSLPVPSTPSPNRERTPGKVRFNEILLHSEQYLYLINFVTHPTAQTAIIES